MRRLVTHTLLAMALIVPTTTAAQDDDGDQGRIVRFLENQLSDGARQITIRGFRGALSSTAEMDLLTIADAEGVWLTLEGAELDWSRRALLRGELQIDALTADRLEIARLPIAEESAIPDLSQAEAQPFSLPDLPVSISVDRVAIDRVSLGAPVIGMAAEMSVEGSAQLSGGAGQADLEIQRLDGPRGVFDLSASYDNASEILDVSLLLEEDEGGLAATLLSLPDNPALRLEVTGSGPLDDFTAEIALASDGTDRLTGQVSTSTTAEAPEDAASGPRLISVDLSGDISPLILPEYQGFFGNSVGLTADVTLIPDGGVEVEGLNLTSAALSLSGSLSLAPGGAPQSFMLTGRIADDDNGARVRLPVPNAEVTVQSVDLSIQHDATQSDEYEATFVLNALDTGSLSIERAELDASGLFEHSPDGSMAVSTPVDIAVTGLSHTDPALAEALGDSATLSAQVSWISGAPVFLTDLDVGSGQLSLTGTGALAFGDSQVTLTTDLMADAPDLSRFAAVSGQPLSGALDAALVAEADILSGAFDVVLEGQGTDLRVAEAVPAALLAGETVLRLSARRDTTGIALRELALRGRQLRLDASGQVGGNGTVLEGAGRLDDVGLFTTAIDGAASAEFSISQAQGEEMPFVIEAELAADAGINTTLSGSYNTDTNAADVTASARISDVGQFTDLISGAVEAEVAVQRAAGDDTPFDIQAELDAAAGITANVTGGYNMSTGAADADASMRLADAGLFTDAVRGPVSADVTVSRADAAAPLDIDADLSGAGGITANVAGSYNLNANTANLRANGQLPLGLANPALRPRSINGTLRFNLALNGTPGPQSLSGSFSTGGARVSLPLLQNAINGLGVTGRLNGGTVTFDANGALASGGDIAANGSVTLTQAGLPAQISVTGRGLRLVDPTLYNVLVDSADVSITGGLARSMQVAGTINLGESELRVPETGLGGSAPIPDIRHINETASERRTRAAAGLIRTDRTGGSPRIGLDLTVNAPGRIFIRGRGLDAELGGSLRIGGTTANMIPSGRFELIRGRLSILGTRLDLTEGSATLQGSFNPFIRLLATSRTSGYIIGIRMVGELSNPEISFTSEPSLPEDEVLAQLLFGRSVSALSPVQLLRMADAAASLAGGGAESGIFANIREGLGLDDLDVQTDAEGNAAVRAGRYLTENIYADVTVGQETDLSLNIDLTPNITARGTVSSDGGSSLGVFYERDY